MSTALVFGTSHTGPFVRGHRLALSTGLVGYDVHGMVFHGDRYEPTVHLTPDRGLQFNPAITEDIAAAIEELQPSCPDYGGHGVLLLVAGIEPAPASLRLPGSQITPAQADRGNRIHSL